MFQKWRLNLEKILVIKNLNMKFGNHSVLKDIDLEIKQGERVFLIGPSGCGKSTVLSIIAGLEEKNSGDIQIEGQIGYMLQKDSLLEWLTIYKNVLFGLEITNMKTTENVKYVDNLLKKYHLYEFKDKYPNQLSGGMRQRAALIRTLAIKPKILLLDEAFSALDYQTRIMVTKDIYDILRKEHITSLIVTHDISEAISMSDRVIILTNRPAVVKEVHEIDFEMENRTPLNCRESPKFSKSFDIIWKGLDVHE